MKREAFEKRVRIPELALGTHKVIFSRIQYREDLDGNITGAFVHVKGYRSLFLPIFEEENFQLDLLLRQLDEESYSEEAINSHEGTEIIVTRYPRGEYTNVSFNPNPREEVEEFA